MNKLWKVLCWLGIHKEPIEMLVFREERDNTFVSTERITHHTVAYRCVRCGHNVWKEWEEKT